MTTPTPTRYVWIVIGSDMEGKWIEAVFNDKVKAEALIRALNADSDGWFYSIQEKAVEK